MTIVRRIREEVGLTQTELAELGGTSQPTIAAYESGAKIPSLRTLLRLADVAGLDLHFWVTPAMTREDRRSLWLHRRIADHLRKEPDLVLAQARSNLRRMRELHDGPSDLFEDWGYIIGGSIDHIVDMLSSSRPRARELRQVTPFAGVLSSEERASLYSEFRDMEMSR